MIDQTLRIVFMGTPDFAVPALERLIESGATIVAAVTQPDRPTGRHQKTVACPVAQTAAAQGIPVLQPEKLRTGEFTRQLTELRPDLFVTAAYGRILPPDVLAVPRLGALNIHGSLLPRHRGASPVHASILAGDRETGVTIMLMDEGMDTGAILTQRAIPIADDDDACTLMDKLARLGADMIVPAVNGVLDGSLKPVAQDASQATITHILTREDGRIDWSRSATEIHNQIRGLYPWPGAYTTIGGKRLKIHRARVLDLDQLDAYPAGGLEPGTVCACAGDAIQVICGAGILELLEIQSDAGRRMACSDCSHNYRFGTRMGGKTDAC